MSAKWRNSLAWDDRFFPAWAWPAKFLLRAFSSIALAVGLLSLVALYGILASTPIGMLALIPTVLVYAATALAAVLVAGALPAWLLARTLAGAPRGTRVVVAGAALVVLGGLALWAWHTWAWPHLRYSETTGTGLRFFAPFVAEYRAITVRRLPGLEMSELEFYSWWPLKVVLLAFVLNLMVATVRRIDFTLPKLGVILVHSGIITIALGSVYYSALKQEGDVLLLAGEPGPDGTPRPGQIESGFFDNTQPVLWVRRGGGPGAAAQGWEQRALRGLPRYNDYALDVLGAAVGDGAATSGGGPARTLDLRVPSGAGFIDADISFRVVGYATYADLTKRWRPVDEAAPPPPGTADNPLRIVELHSSISPPPGGDSPPRVDEIPFVPLSPADRLATLGRFVAIEYTRGMSDDRWEALSSPLPAGVQHALLVEVPGFKHKAVVPIAPGHTFDAAGYRLEVRSISPAPPFDIITKGYEGATSSVCVVHVTPPEPLGGAKAAFERYVYHRFGEINQDMLDGDTNERGMPRRRNADKSILLTYIDASTVQVYLDEIVPGGAEPGAAATDPLVRAIVRAPGAEPRVIDGLASGESIPFGPQVSLKLGKRWNRAERVEVPVPVPERDREREAIGNHKRAAVAIEVSANPPRVGAPPAWSRVVWVPFTQYLGEGVSSGAERTVSIPVGAAPAGTGAAPAERTITLAFGRRWHPFPDLHLQLADFEMFPYPHSTQPRDFKSNVRVFRGRTLAEAAVEDRHTSLNDPLLVRVPFTWSPERPALANALGWLVSWVAPTQFKFSQAGWDQRGWTATKEAAARGELPRPFANFTILGVGNSPGIYIIAAGAVMMSVGIPYAFYLKPIILRRRKEAIQRAVARGEYAAGRAAHPPSPTPSSASPPDGADVPPAQSRDAAPANGHSNGHAATSQSANRR